MWAGILTRVAHEPSHNIGSLRASRNVGEALQISSDSEGVGSDNCLGRRFRADSVGCLSLEGFTGRLVEMSEFHLKSARSPGTVVERGVEGGHVEHRATSNRSVADASLKNPSLMMLCSTRAREQLLGTPPVAARGTNRFRSGDRSVARATWQAGVLFILFMAVWLNFIISACWTAA